MLINIPNQLTNEEEQLLKKIAKMTKKKKQFFDKKSTTNTSSVEAAPVASASSQNSASSAQKKTTNLSTEAKLDAKEAAKKLIQSGVIKFDTEQKTTFKRSCSRKDKNLKDLSAFDGKRPNLNQDINNSNTSLSSLATQSPPMSSNSPNFYGNKFQFPLSGDNQYSPNRNFRKSLNQTPNSTYATGSPTTGASMSRFQNTNYSGTNSNNQICQQNGVSLFIKANNVTEDLLRSLFSANVSQAKIISIDVKTNFAFVSVDTREAADTAIQEDSLFSVSLARPRKQFNRNNSFNSNSNFERSNSFNASGVSGGNEIANTMETKSMYSHSHNTSNTNMSSPTKSPNSSVNDSVGSGNNSLRQIINYEDI